MGENKEYFGVVFVLARFVSFYWKKSFFKRYLKKLNVYLFFNFRNPNISIHLRNYWDENINALKNSSFESMADK